MKANSRTFATTLLFGVFATSAAARELGRKNTWASNKLDHAPDFLVAATHKDRKSGMLEAPSSLLARS
jgi:hypothetical protein